MKINKSKNMECIECGDLVYSRTINEYGFIGFIDNRYYFIDNDSFNNWSSPYEDLNKLIRNAHLELIAKNKDLNISY